MLAGIGLCTLLALGGCARHQKEPWSTILCSDGRIFVLNGHEINETAPRYTVHGTFKSFTTAVRRTFVLYDYATPSRILGRFDVKNEESDHGTYDYFATDGILVASYDSWGPALSNLSSGNSFPVRGLLCNLRQTGCRFALTHESDSQRWYLYEKTTGAENSLPPEALSFIDDSWHTDFFILEDGAWLAKIVSDYGTKQFVVSTWNLKQNRIGPASPPVDFGTYHEPLVRFVARHGDGLIFVYGAPDWETHGYALTSAECTAGELKQRTIYTSDHLAIGGMVDVVPNGDSAVTIVHRLSDTSMSAPRRWAITQVDFLTGQTIKTDLIDLENSAGANRDP